MQRNAFKMQLKPGYEAEYKKRHDEIWPELAEELGKAGVSDYSIFLDDCLRVLKHTSQLSGCGFCYAKASQRASSKDFSRAR